jgi:hypothetical protein
VLALQTSGWFLGNVGLDSLNSACKHLSGDQLHHVRPRCRVNCGQNFCVRLYPTFDICQTVPPTRSITATLFSHAVERKARELTATLSVHTDSGATHPQSSSRPLDLDASYAPRARTNASTLAIRYGSVKLSRGWSVPGCFFGLGPGRSIQL